MSERVSEWSQVPHARGVSSPASASVSRVRMWAVVWWLVPRRALGWLSGWSREGPAPGAIACLPASVAPVLWEVEGAFVVVVYFYGGVRVRVCVWVMYVCSSACLWWRG